MRRERRSEVPEGEKERETLLYVLTTEDDERETSRGRAEEGVRRGVMESNYVVQLVALIVLIWRVWGTQQVRMAALYEIVSGCHIQAHSTQTYTEHLRSNMHSRTLYTGCSSICARELTPLLTGSTIIRVRRLLLGREDSNVEPPALAPNRRYPFTRRPLQIHSFESTGGDKASLLPVGLILSLSAPA
jgi:hypothetical protein